MLPRPGVSSTAPARFQGSAAFLLLGFVALLTGVMAGLLRIGWTMPGPHGDIAQVHGPLMVSGFLGTLIGLERAIGFGKSWALIGPVMTGLGSLGLLLGFPPTLPIFWITVGSLTLVAVLALYQHSSLPANTMTLGALVWAFGNAAWLAGVNVIWLFPWWAGFLILTIAGERLELAGIFHDPTLARRTFALALVPLLLGLLLASAEAVSERAGRPLGAALLFPGVRLMGMGMLALAAWLLQFDLARRTVRETGLRRFMAINLLGGYVWLGIGGVLWLLFWFVPAPYLFDAGFHAVFLGFVFSMIFAHAPVIFPAVLGRAIAFSRAFYAHAALLHVSLVLRVAGDLVEWSPGRQWGGLLNALALVLFLLNTLGGLLRARFGAPDAVGAP